MFGTTPESGEAKLCVGVEKGFFEETLLWMVELTNEREIETRLPLLNKGYFEASVVHSVCIYGNWSPKCTNCHAQVAKRQFGLDQSLVGELEIFARSAVLSVESMMHCRAQVKLGLHVGDMGKPDVDALRLEKLSGKQVVRV